MEQYKHIFDKYKAEPYFEIRIDITTGYRVQGKFNALVDKTTGPVMRARYIIYNAIGERQSMKVLKMTKPVEFKEVRLDANRLDLIDAIEGEEGDDMYSSKELLIGQWFGQWINTYLRNMLESGEQKITKMTSV